MVINRLPALLRSVEAFSKEDVYVGVPSDNTERKETSHISNAVIAYINDNGSPAQNIPARPFMRPGIESAKEDIKSAFKRGAEANLKGNEAAIDIAMHQAGLIAQRNIRAVINAGIAPALAESTLKARARRGSKGAKTELKSRSETGISSATGSAKPLIETGQLRNSINYVIRSKDD